MKSGEKKADSQLIKSYLFSRKHALLSISYTWHLQKFVPCKTTFAKYAIDERNCDVEKVHKSRLINYLEAKAGIKVVKRLTDRL